MSTPSSTDITITHTLARGEKKQTNEKQSNKQTRFRDKKSKEQAERREQGGETKINENRREVETLKRPLCAKKKNEGTFFDEEGRVAMGER